MESNCTVEMKCDASHLYCSLQVILEVFQQIIICKNEKKMKLLNILGKL